ncbi:hypothetical protein BDA96_04G075900 [Sorghum bicolor]|uniref:Uncharacterized protein n=2 Tax=Sorghum bicolor TaxID=4558 RepID=A0A921R2Q6_SORBI|nr:hypothetical protein BDA96_04G075900 [Sorghum bicolor]KXG29644.1 hypothetical protein SORBI_3004G070300 [Sorghum bicolor]
MWPPSPLRPDRRSHLPSPLLFGTEYILLFLKTSLHHVDILLVPSTFCSSCNVIYCSMPLLSQFFIYKLAF